MMRKTRRLLSALLAAALALSLTACGEKREAHKINWVTASAYASEDVALPVETGELFGSCTDGTSIWFLAAVGGEAARLYQADLEEGAVETLEEYRPPEAPEDAVLVRYGPERAPDGTLWVYETWTVFHYDLPEDFDPDMDLKGSYYTGEDIFCHLRQLDSRIGREKKLVDLSAAYQTLNLGGTFGVTDFLVDGGGNIYLAGPGGIAVLDGHGELQFTLEADIPDTGLIDLCGGRLALLPDGTAAVLTTRSNRREVRTIDPAAQDWGEDVWSIPGDVGTVISGQGGCLFCYVRDNALYGVVEGDELPQRLLPLENTRLEGISGMACFALLDGGRLAILTRQYAASGRAYESRIQLALLSPTDQLPEDGKARIVYGSIGKNSYIQNRINAFNRESGQYYIEYRDYTEGALETAENYEEMTVIRNAARLRLAGEIAAGRAPDIMSDSLPLDVYARAGYLEDLWPWIDGDPEISRGGVMDHVLKCASLDGELYQVGGSFRIETAVASRSVTGNRTGWTLEEMQAAFGGTMPMIYAGTTDMLYACNAEETLWQLLDMDMDRYVDWEMGECRFDGEAFKDLLRLCAGAGTGEMTYAPATPRLWEGEPALCQITMTGIEDLTSWDVWCGGPETLSAEEYEAALWDAGVLYTFVSPYNGQEVTNYKNAGFVSNMEATMEGRFSKQPAADAVYGVPDGKLYASFAGVPTGDGAGSSFILENPVAISASSQVKEGAWAFVRPLLLPGGYLYTDSWEGMDVSTSYGFPMNRSDFESLLEPQWCRVEGDGELILDKDGQPIEAAADWPMTVGYPVVMAAYRMAPNQAQLDRFWALYNAIDRVGGGNDELIRMIAEQAQPYFAGDKSLDETVDLIQRQVSLYVNENR